MRAAQGTAVPVKAELAVEAPQNTQAGDREAKHAQHMPVILYAVSAETVQITPLTVSKCVRKESHH